MRASTVLVSLAASSVASALASFVVAAIWVLVVAGSYGAWGLSAADAPQAILYVGGFAALVTLACAVPLGLVLFLIHRPLLDLLSGSLFRYVVAGLVAGVLSQSVMWGLGLEGDVTLSVLIACIAGPAASTTFWMLARRALAPPPT